MFGTSSSTVRPSSAVRSTSATRPSMPASVGRQSMAPHTDQNRKIIFEKANRVIDLLQGYESEFENRLNLGNALKSMTAKQFVDIIQFFRHKISGKSFLATDRQSNVETELLAFIQKLSYPTTVAKSWFKTPTAPHAYAECVTLLAWLAEYVADSVEIDMDDDDSEIECDAEFPNVDYTRIFSAGAQQAFPLWNKGDDEEFDAITDELIDANVIIQMDHRVNNVAELIKFTDELRQSNDNFKTHHVTELSAPPMDTNFYDIKLNDVQTKLRMAHEQRALTVDRYERTTKRNRDLTQKFTDKKTQLTELQQKVQSQTYTLLDMEQQIAIESTLKQTKTMLTNDLTAIRHINSGQQIAIARMKKQFDDAITEFSKLLLNCERLAAKFGVQIQREIQIPRLDPTNIYESIRRAIDGLNKVANLIERYHRHLQQRCDEKQIVKKRLETELNFLKENVEKQTIHAAHIKTQLMDGSKILGELELEYTHFELKLMESAKGAMTIYQQLCRERMAYEDKANKMKEENDILFATKKQQHLEVIAKRREQIDEFSDFFKGLDEL